MPDTINPKKSEATEKPDIRQPTTNLEVPRRKNGIIETISRFKESLSRSLSDVDPREINEIEAYYSEEKRAPRYFDEEWYSSCPKWSNTFSESNRKRQCRRGECTNFLRKLVNGGHVTFNYFDRFFYIYLGWWHDEVLIFRKDMNASNVSDQRLTQEE